MDAAEGGKWAKPALGMERVMLSGMHSMGRITDWHLQNAREAYARTISAAGSKIGDAANRAMGMAKDTLQSAAEQVRERATTAVATYTKEDPIRAILIAAGEARC